MTMTSITIVNEDDEEMKDDFRRLDLEVFSNAPETIDVFASGRYGSIYEEARVSLTVAETEKLVEELQKWLLKRSAAARQTEQSMLELDYAGLLGIQTMSDDKLIHAYLFKMRQEGHQIHLKVDRRRTTREPSLEIIMLTDRITRIDEHGTSKIVRDRNSEVSA